MNKMNDIFNPDAMAKIAGKKDSLQGIADSSDGKAVREMLDNTTFSKAVESGDMESIRAAVSQIMNTKEGARLFRQLSDMMK